MYRTGLLLLTSSVSNIQCSILPILSQAAECIKETLYVNLQTAQPLDVNSVPIVPLTKQVTNLVTSIYTNAADVCQHLDVRVLLSNISNKNVNLSFPWQLSKDIDVVLTDYPQNEQLHHIIGSMFNVKSTPQFNYLRNCEFKVAKDNENEEMLSYGSIVLGGTFDRLHNGHKILLSVSCLLAEERITVGVTDGKMNCKKTVCELICPIEERISDVVGFIRDIKPSVLRDQSVVPIIDPFGPSIVDPDMQCIVVSEETKKGGNMVNQKRIDKGLCKLYVYEIGLIADSHHAPHEESKISSSSQRQRLLGTLLKPPQLRGGLTTKPYILGLTGGSASGKSSICKRLQTLGAGVIDCDKLGHKAYEPGTEAYRNVIRAFGEDIVADNGQINRKALGAKVFADKSRLHVLNQIVWPEIANLFNQQIAALAKQGKEVIVLDAAVLIEANWTKYVHEVWVSIIPKDEAITRIINRDGLTNDRALQRIESQITNNERVKDANVIFSTLWEPDITQKQVEKAWKLLMERLPTIESDSKL